MTFQDLDKIPGLSRPWKMCLSNSMTFHDFPGPVATLMMPNAIKK